MFFESGVSRPTVSTKDSKKIDELNAGEAAALGGVMAGGVKSKYRRPDGRIVHLRKAAGKVWNDRTLDEWPTNDFRVFVGDIGNEVTEDLLAAAFKKYASFQKAKVVRDRRSGRSKGYGFVSFGKPDDLLAALNEMDKKYVGNRPIRVIRSRWGDREIDSQKNKELANLISTAPTKSKTLRKFKKVGVAVTGGKRVNEAAERPAAPPRKGRGYYGTASGTRSWMTTTKTAPLAPAAGSGHLLDNI